MNKLVVAMVVLAACGGGSDNDNDNDPICGDALTEGAEQCDDGNVASGDGCSATCVVEPRCGDAIVNGADQCDDGNTAPGDGCGATCMLECGNGVPDPGEECDDGDTTSFDGCSATCTIEGSFAITASWQLRTVAGTVQACPQGYDTAAVLSQPIDSNGGNLGTPVIDLFDCSAATGTTGPLSEGRYKVHLAIMNDNATMTYATTPTTIIVLDADKSFSATLYTDGGYFAWVWNLIGATSNTALTCAQAAADGVELTSTLTSNSMALTDIYDCTDGSGLTAVLPAGSYTVSAAALDSNDQPIGTAPTLTNKQIAGPNKITDLGTVTIPIQGM